MRACWSWWWWWGGPNRLDTSHQSQCRPGGARGCGRSPTGTCRSSVLGAVIFLSATDLMTEPRGLITPPPPTHQPPPAPLSTPLSYPGACQRGVCSATGVAVHIKAPPPSHRSSSPWPRAQPFILKWRRPAPHQPGPSACSLLHCLASEKDYYFNSIYCE